MSRAAKVKSSAVTVILIAALGFGSWAYIANTPSHNVSVVTNAQHQTTQLTYHGHTGKTALALLEKHASVQIKHYSFGDMVTAVDGTKGAGPKYWTFYVNGKQANVGAGAYTTKNSDTITWRLES